MYGEGVRSSVHTENPWLFACCSADYIQMIGFFRKRLGILLWKVKVKQPLRCLTTQRTTRSVLSGSAQVWLVLCLLTRVHITGPRQTAAEEPQQHQRHHGNQRRQTQRQGENHSHLFRPGNPNAQPEVTHQGAMDRTSTRIKSFKWKLMII